MAEPALQEVWGCPGGSSLIPQRPQLSCLLGSSSQPGSMLGQLTVLSTQEAPWLQTWQQVVTVGQREGHQMK